MKELYFDLSLWDDNAIKTCRRLVYNWFEKKKTLFSIVLICLNTLIKKSYSEMRKYFLKDFLDIK